MPGSWCSHALSVKLATGRTLQEVTFAENEAAGAFAINCNITFVGYRSAMQYSSRLKNIIRPGLVNIWATFIACLELMPSQKSQSNEVDSLVDFFIL